MRKVIIFLLLCIYTNLKSQDYQCNCPYPILFVHGWAGGQDSWSPFTSNPDVNKIFGSLSDTHYSVLNADTSNILSEDVLLTFLNENNYLNNDTSMPLCMYQVSFGNYYSGSSSSPTLIINSNEQPLPENEHSDSNESGAFKQGYALGHAIERVLQATGKEKVILVGHSMGGLAIREYLQRREPQNNDGVPVHWRDTHHNVAKVITIGTPHLGSNTGNFLNYFKNPPQILDLDVSSEAVRDLRVFHRNKYDLSDPLAGPYLFGGLESELKSYDDLVSSVNFDNYDINSNGSESDYIEGINKKGNNSVWKGTEVNPNMELPRDVKYNYLVSNSEQQIELLAVSKLKNAIKKDWMEVLCAITGEPLDTLLKRPSDGIVFEDRQWLYFGGDGSHQSHLSGNCIPVPLKQEFPYFLSDRITAGNENYSVVHTSALPVIYNAAKWFCNFEETLITELSGNNGKMIIKETEDIISLIRGLDEPDYPYFAYEVEKDNMYAGVIQIRADKVPNNSSRSLNDRNDIDSDWYFLDLSKSDIGDNCNILVELLEVGGEDGTPYFMEVFDKAADPVDFNIRNNQDFLASVSGIKGDDAAQKIIEFNRSEIGYDTLFIRITHNDIKTENWKNPYKFRIVSKDCIDFCTPIPTLSYTNQKDQIVSIQTDQVITYKIECGELPIFSGCNASSWFIVNEFGIETFQNQGSSFEYPQFTPAGVDLYEYKVRVYNQSQSDITTLTPYQDFFIRVLINDDCSQSCSCVYENDEVVCDEPSTLTEKESGASMRATEDCADLPPCATCGSKDISNYCVLPLVKDTTIRLCDPLPTFEALDDCYQWFESSLNGGIYASNYNSLREGRFFTPNNITQAGTYYYQLVDIRKSLIEGCSIVLKINAVDCEEEPVSVSINECVQAGATETITWSGVDASTIRLSLSIDDGQTWIFPSDLKLSDSGFGLSTSNDGSFEWSIPCFSEVVGLEIVESTNAIIGLFEDNGQGFSENGYGLIDTSEPFTIKRCEDCLDISIDSLNIKPNAELEGGVNQWIAAFISNQGFVEIPSSPNCQIEFYFSDDEVADADEFIEDEQIGKLDIGDTDLEYINFTIPNDKPDGQYYFIMRLRCQTDYGEACDDSELIVPIIKGNAEVDLFISSATITPNGSLSPSCQYTIQTTIQNVGTLGVDDTSIGVYLSQDQSLGSDDIFLGLYQVPQMFANEALEQYLDFMLPENLSDGQYYLLLDADHDQEETESNEQNNLFVKAITIENKPDLVVTSASLSAIEIYGNGEFPFDVVITNEGTIASSTSSYTIYISLDNQFDGADTEIMSFTLPALLAGESVTLSDLITFPDLSESGLRYLLFYADVDNTIMEKSEENNIGVVPVRVSPFALDCDITPAVCGGANGKFRVDPLGGTSPFTYLWSTGVTTQEISELPADYYSVTVTDGNGNSITKSSYVSDNGNPKWEWVEAFPVNEGCTSWLIEKSYNNKMYIYCRDNNTLSIYTEDGTLELSKTYTGIKDVTKIGVGSNGDIYLIGNHYGVEGGVPPPPLPPLCTGCSGYSTLDWGGELIKLDGSGNVLDSRTLGYSTNSTFGGTEMTSLGFEFNVLVNSSGDVYLQTASNGFIQGQIYTSSDLSTSLSIGAASTSNFSESYLIHYDNNMDWVFHQSYASVNALSPTNVINAIEIAADDNLYLITSQGGGSAGAPSLTSYYPFGPYNVSMAVSLRRILKLNPSLGLEWMQTIDNDRFSFYNSIGFDINGNPYYHCESTNAFGTGASGGNIFSLDKNTGSINWYREGFAWTFLGNQNDIIFTTEEVFNGSNGETLASSPTNALRYSTLTLNPNGGFNAPLECYDCTIGEFSFEGNHLIWGVFAYNDKATSHSVELGDTINVCSQESVILDAQNEGLDFLWSTGASSQTIVVSESGNYAVSVTNDMGCEAIDSVFVRVLEDIEIEAVTSDDFCNQSNGTIRVNVQGGLAPYAYAWADGDESAFREGLSAGNYVVTITDSSQCIKTTTIAIEADAGVNSADITPAATTCGMSNGEVAIGNIIGGEAPYRAMWSDGEMGLNRQNLASGDYEVTITDTHGCMLIKSVNITSSVALEATINKQNPTGCGASDGMIAVIPSPSATLPVTYLWNDGAEGDTRDNLSEGTYVVTLTDAARCRTSVVVELIDSGASPIEYSVEPAHCSDGSISLQLDSQFEPYTILWSTGASNTSIDNLQAGIYEVQITDNRGCETRERIEVDGVLPLDVSVEKNSLLCEEINEVSVSINGGVPPYNVLWSNGETSQTVEYAAGTYEVQVTDNQGCEILMPFEVSEQSRAMNIQFEPDKSICHGESAEIALFIEGIEGPFDLVLSDGNNLHEISNFEFGETISLYPEISTTYTLESVTDVLGCKAYPDASIRITVHPKIYGVLDIEDIFVCEGTQAKLSPIIVGGKSPYDLLYNNGQEVFSYENYTEGDTIILPENGGDHYYLTKVTDANGCVFHTIDEFKVYPVPCQLTNNYLPTDPCSCNDDQSANGAMDGTFSETISVVGTMETESWTITEVQSLAGGVLPTGISVGDELIFESGNNRHNLSFSHTDRSGFLINVEGPNEVGNINNVSLEIRNVCKYPQLKNDVLAAQYNTCEVSFLDLQILNGEQDGEAGSLDILVDGVAVQSLDLTSLTAGYHEVEWIFEGDFTSNQNGTALEPAYPGCSTSLTESFELINESVSLVCNDLVQISVTDQCEVKITPAMLVETEYMVGYELILANGESGSSRGVHEPFTGINWEGVSFNQSVDYLITGNCGVSCSGSFVLEDKLPPIVSCPETEFIPCYKSYLPYSEEVFASLFVEEHCGEVIVKMVSDETLTLDCHDTNYPNAQAVRTICYAVEDEFGNRAETCCYEVWYQKANMDLVVFPEDKSLSCQNYESWDGQVDPTTESPYFEGQAGRVYLPSLDIGSPCRLQTSFTDQIFPICDGAYRVLREWTIMDWCSGEMRTANQILTIESSGFTATSIKEDYQIGVQSDICGAVFTLPFTDIELINGCSENYFIDLRVKLCEENAVLYQYDTSIPNRVPETDLLAAGCYDLTYSLRSNCGEESQFTISLEVADNQPPQAICEGYTTLSLTDGGYGEIESWSLDDGSFDFCSAVEFSVRRNDGNNTGISTGNFEGKSYYDRVHFNCDDVGKTISVSLLVNDEAYNQSVCIGEVYVQDKSTPDIVCPQSFVSYGYQCGNEEVPDLGEPSYVLGSSICDDGYRIELVSANPSEKDDCGDYTIAKRWNIMRISSGEVISSCSQQIQMENESLFTEANIVWPSEDITYEACDLASVPASLLGSPQFVGGFCNNVGHTYVDQFYPNVDGYCLKVIRTWKVVDWCRFDVSGGDEGTFSFVQVIKLYNSDEEGEPSPIIQGRVHSWNGMDFDSTMVSLSALEDDRQTMVDSDGEYAFQMETDDNYAAMVLSPSNDLHCNQGVSTLDLVKIQRHILGLAPFDSPYQIIAADVNNSESITASDLVELRKLILGINEKFTHNTSWRFIDSLQAFTDTGHPWPLEENIAVNLDDSLKGYNFMGIKIGDVNDYEKEGFHEPSERSNHIFSLYAQDWEYKQGEEVIVPVYSSSTSLIGIQGTIAFDSDELVFKQAVGGILEVNSSHIGSHKKDDGLLSISWNTEIPLEVKEGDVLMYLYFIAKTGGDLSSLSWNSELTPSEYYPDTDVIGSVQLSLIRTMEEELSFSVSQNRPNPFVESTMIDFTLPKAAEVTLEVYNTHGKRCLTQFVKGTQGQNQLWITKKDLGAAGVYLYTLKTPFGSRSKKLIMQ